MISQSFSVVDVIIMQEARLSISSRACDGKLLSTTIANHVKALFSFVLCASFYGCLSLMVQTVAAV